MIYLEIEIYVIIIILIIAIAPTVSFIITLIVQELKEREPKIKTCNKDILLKAILTRLDNHRYILLKGEKIVDVLEYDLISVQNYTLVFKHKNTEKLLRVNLQDITDLLKGQ